MLPLKHCPPCWNEISDVHDEPSVKTISNSYFRCANNRCWAHSAPFHYPAAAAAPMVGSIRRFSPGRIKTAKTARTCGSRRILPCARLWTAAMAFARLPSLAVGSLSREPRTRPALPSIGHVHVSASPERSVRGEISSTSGLLSPQNPHARSLQTTGIPERGIQCI